MSDPLGKERRDYFPAAHNSGPRPLSGLRWIVLHSTEGVVGPGGDEATGHFFHDPSNPNVGSSNIIVDDDTTQRVLDDGTIPWGAPPLNTNGLHIEQAGHAAFSTAEWMQHRAVIERAAFAAARWCKAYNIPMLFRSTADLKRIGQNPGPGKGGITTHANISAAWHETTHTDPGSGYPIDLFMQLVKGGDDVSPEQAQILKDAKAFMDAAKKSLGRKKEPDKPAAAVDAGRRIGRSARRVEDGKVTTARRG